MGEHQLEKFEFDVGEYHCKARALSIGEWESLDEGALPFISAYAQEEVILACLLEPKELRVAIEGGDIIAGIPLLIFDIIINNSGFGISPDDRDSYLQIAREEISTSVVESCKVIILAAGIMPLEEIQQLSFLRLLYYVALAENVLRTQQDNMLAALGGGQPIALTWTPQDSEVDNLMQKHYEKVQEVQELLQSQVGNSRYGLGARRL